MSEGTNMTKRVFLRVDMERCEGHGQCEFVAPQLLHLDDQGLVVIDVEDVTDQQELAKKAVQSCPAIALWVE